MRRIAMALVMAGGLTIERRVTATGSGGTIVAESAPKVPANACIVPALIGKTKKRKSTRKPGYWDGGC
jgi:hypothetical protein